MSIFIFLNVLGPEKSMLSSIEETALAGSSTSSRSFFAFVLFFIATALLNDLG